MVPAASIIIGVFVAFLIIGVAVTIIRCGWYRSRPSRRHHSSHHPQRHVPFRHQCYDSYLYAKPLEEGKSRGSSKSTNVKSGKDSVRESEDVKEPEMAHVRSL